VPSAFGLPGQFSAAAAWVKPAIQMAARKKRAKNMKDETRIAWRCACVGPSPQPINGDKALPEKPLCRQE
jgi:hypothetical protein